MARAVVGDRDRDAAHVAPAMTGEGSIIARHIATSDPELDAENLRIYGIDLILSSLRTQVFPPSKGVTKLGLDLATRKLVIVKSTQHFHAGFAPIAKSIADSDEAAQAFRFDGARYSDMMSPRAWSLAGW
jgi:hypothetical protein